MQCLISAFRVYNTCALVQGCRRSVIRAQTTQTLAYLMSLHLVRLHLLPHLKCLLMHKLKAIRADLKGNKACKFLIFMPTIVCTKVLLFIHALSPELELAAR